jgi:hypothetical protein
MTRRLLNLVTALSLLLCVAVLALWVRSYRYDDQVSFAATSRHCGLRSFRGRVGLSWTSPDPGWRTYTGAGWRRRPIRNLAPGQADLEQHCERQLWGFGFGRFSFQTGITTGAQMNHLVVVPYWAVLAASLVPAAPGALAARRCHRRRQAGRCPRCGYDLSATPDRCPECGEAATT